MRIVSARINTLDGKAFELAPSPTGHDGELWPIPNGRLRDTCGVTRGVLASADVELTLRLDANPSPSKRISIDGAAAAGSSVFCDDVRGYVEPGQWKDGRAECRIRLDTTALRARGVTWGPAVWDWRWTEDRPRALGASQHLVFVTAGAPTFPWTEAARPKPNEARPWPGVLALACEWASGATDVAALPARILEGIVRLQHGPGLPWRYESGASSYLTPEFGPHLFYCELFIAAARNLNGAPHELSCYEGAAVMTTFVNVLGGALRPVLIRRDDCPMLFELNSIWPIGLKPEAGCTFHVHVVACLPGGQSADFRAFDPLIRFDPDADPANKPNPFAFASGVPLGRVTDRPGAGFYLPQMIDKRHIRSCAVRKLAVAHIERPDRCDFEECDVKRLEHYRRELETLVATQVRPPTMFGIPGFTRTAGTQFPPPFPRPDKLPAVPQRTRTVYEPATPDAPDDKGARLIADFWSGSPNATLSFMAELMARADRPPIRVEGPHIAYISPHGGTLWVLYDGAAVRLSTVGRRRMDLTQILAVATPQ